MKPKKYHHLPAPTTGEVDNLVEEANHYSEGLHDGMDYALQMVDKSTFDRGFNAGFIAGMFVTLVAALLAGYVILHYILEVL